MFRTRVYLDQAAGVTPNPSSPHTEGRKAKQLLEEARTTIARLTEVQADDVIFTSGATESNALAILGFVRALQKQGKASPHILYLPSAHASLVENVHLLKDEGCKIEPLPIRDARIDIEKMPSVLKEDTVLIVTEAVCGETGVIWNTRELAQMLRNLKTSSRPLLHVDASQAPLTEKITRDHFGADLMSLDASKVSSIRGVGVLVSHRTTVLTPLYAGGGQERGLRPGTEIPELVATFAKDLQKVVQYRDSFRKGAEEMRKEFIECLQSEIPDLTLQAGKIQAPHIVNIGLRGRDTDYLVALLDEAGFAVSTKSACETDSEEGSRAVFTLTGDTELAKSTLRISWGPSVSRRDLKRFADALIRSVRFIDRGE